MGVVILTLIFFSYVKTDEMTEEQVNNYEEYLGGKAGSTTTGGGGATQGKTIDVKCKGDRINESLMNINIGAED